MKTKHTKAVVVWSSLFYLYGMRMHGDASLFYLYGMHMHGDPFTRNSQPLTEYDTAQAEDWNGEVADPAKTDLLLLTRGELKKPYRLPDAKLLLLNVKEHRNSQNKKCQVSTREVLHNAKSTNPCYSTDTVVVNACHHRFKKHL